MVSIHQRTPQECLQGEEFLPIPGFKRTQVSNMCRYRKEYGFGWRYRAARPNTTLCEGKTRMAVHTPTLVKQVFNIPTEYDTPQESMSDEVWKDHPKFPGVVSVSSTGRSLYNKRYRGPDSHNLYIAVPGGYIQCRIGVWIIHQLFGVYLKGAPKRSGSQNPGRDKLMYDMKASGSTFADIGRHFGISRSRVAVLMKRIEKEYNAT